MHYFAASSCGIWIGLKFGPECGFAAFSFATMLCAIGDGVIGALAAKNPKPPERKIFIP